MVFSPPNGSLAPTITCWGAAQSVTGSMHLLEAGGHKILLDCGLFLGPRLEARQRNSHFPFPPHEIDAVVLSHAHSDHCGNLPNLVRQGFTGPIYCTPPTRDLVGLMLVESARIQQEEALVLSVLEQRDDSTERALYTRWDADQTLEQCVALPYEQLQEIGPGVQVRLVDAGHILGSAMVHLTMDHSNAERSLTFTGDLGRPGLPLLRDPSPLPPADLLLCESTYGGRIHEPVAQTIEALEAVARRTLERDGKLLLPAFSLGRTQVVVHLLQQAIRAGRLPSVPVFVDSPLAADMAEVYRRHPAYLDPALARQLEHDPGFLGGETVRYVRPVEESRRLTTRRGPCIVVASGRMLEHLKHSIDDPRCSVVLVGYQPPHTVGRKLLERGPTVRFLGRKWNKWADVIELPGLSGHADHNDMLRLLGPLAGRTPRVRLVHGEAEQGEALRRSLREQGFADVEIPRRGEVLSLA